MAFKWWLPFLSLIASVYLFAVTLLPRRPVFAGLVAIGFAFAPFFQWWFGPNTFWPAAWALLVMTTVVWLLRTRGHWPRILFPLVTAYLAVAVGTTVYIPFILPAVLVAVAFGVGAVATPSTSSVQGLRTRLKSLRGLLIAAIAAAAVLVVWVLTRLDTIRGLSSTVYPGERRQLVGAATLRDVVALFSAPFSADLDRAEGIPLDINASEAATFVLIGLFLAIPLLWTVVAGKRGTGVDWTSVALLALGLLLLAFMFIPGWDPVAHLLFLDRVPLVRLRYAFGLLALVLIVMLALRLDERRASGMARVPWWVVAITAIAAAGTSAVVAWFLLPFQSVLTADDTWIVLSILAVLAVTAFTMRLPVWGAAIVLVISLATGATVNPVYAGVYDLNGNSVVKEMKRVDAQAPGTWVGAGNTSLLTIALLQSGLPSLNGFQGAPSRKIWDEIDPAGTDEKAWNRLANVSWTFGQGAPDPRNPADDQILLTFDSCASFAQHRVSYVLSELQSDQPCLELVESVQPGPLRFYIYRVVTGP
ncbi:hypothetical protein IFT89_02020 [Plantibacter sp. CFBP 13570]|nr:hypothetical protein [Plantibacter sp. CFBP 13570]MBD8533861.1 hypothetical protein [Plantibacter sp. CFBP 13570]